MTKKQKTLVTWVRDLLALCTVVWMVVTTVQYLNPPKVAEVVPTTVIKVDEGVAKGSMVGVKNRAECSPVDGSMTGYYRTGEVWKETRFSFDDDPSPGSSKPEGENDFDTWVWEDVSPETKEVLMTMQHVCNGRVVASEFGPYEVF